MKPIASTMTEIDNLPGEEVEFTISDANKAWVMRSMADLYSNRELACAREYSTNAYDANKEKAIRDGHEVRPIEVTLPSALNPYFSVKDSGVGMSASVLKYTYTQFGESTKRISDDFNGMLGFGSKAAVAYTNTFTITSVHRGHKTVAVVTRREDAMGGYVLSLKVILSVPTTEEDGVLVQIPVHNWDEFTRKAMDFYRFWPEGTVKINGRISKPEVGDKIGEGLFYSKHFSMSYVVMNNVPYRIANPDALFPRGMNKIPFVAYLDPCKCDYVTDEWGNPVEHAQVEFTPSREDLKYSDHTKHHLNKIVTDFVNNSVNTAKAEIAKATTHIEAYEAWSKWRGILGVNQVDALSFKGDKFIESFPIVGRRYDASAYRYGTWDINQWEVARMKSTIIITDFTPENLASAHKKKVKEWSGLKNIQATYFIFTEAKTVDSPWIPTERVVDWEQVKADVPKAPRTPRPKASSVAWGRRAGSFDLLTKSGKQREQDVPDSKTLYYIMVREYNEHGSLTSVLADLDLDDKIVLLPANRKDKFLRHYPHAKPVLPWLKSKVVLDGESLLSKDARTYLSLDRVERHTLSLMDENKINDPNIRSLVKICKKPEDRYVAEYNKHYNLAFLVGMGGQFKQHPWTNYWNARGTALTKEYPLAIQSRSMLSDQRAEHVYYYMNAVFAARKEGKGV